MLWPSYLLIHLNSFPPPKRFTNALLRSKDITALIRDTEVHERALFKVAPSEPSNLPIYQSVPRRSTVSGLKSGSEHFSNNTGLLRTGRQHPAVATLLGGELGDQLRIEDSQAGKEHGEIDVSLLLKGAERLSSI